MKGFFGFCTGLIFWIGISSLEIDFSSTDTVFMPESLSSLDGLSSLLFLKFPSDYTPIVAILSSFSCSSTSITSDINPTTLLAYYFLDKISSIYSFNLCYSSFFLELYVLGERNLSLSILSNITYFLSYFYFMFIYFFLKRP